MTRNSPQGVPFLANSNQQLALSNQSERNQKQEQEQTQGLSTCPASRACLKMTILKLFIARLTLKAGQLAE